MINKTMILTVNGTRQSERAGGLGDGEVSIFTNRPGEYRKDLQTIDDLVGNIAQSAYMRGEWISSMKLDDQDLVRDYALGTLREHLLNIGEAAIEMSQNGMFAAADLEDLITLLQVIKSENFDD